MNAIAKEQELDKNVTGQREKQILVAVPDIPWNSRRTSQKNFI